MQLLERGPGSKQTRHELLIPKIFELSDRTGYDMCLFKSSAHLLVATPRGS